MKDKDFDKAMLFKVIKNSALAPDNDMAHDYINNMSGIVALKDISTRDLSFHKAYMGLLKFIWMHLPAHFQNAVPQKEFYSWLKHLQGKYKIKYTFQDGSKFIEYESISFGRMSQSRFKEYVATQLPIIYEDVIRKVYDEDSARITIDIIEDKWKEYLSKLNN